MKRKIFIFGLLLMLAFVMVSCGNASETSTTAKVSTEQQTSNKPVESSKASAVSTTAIKYTVTFDSKGGTEISTQEIEKGSKVTKPTDPTKDGYTFGGWYSDSFYFYEYDFNDKVLRNLTLHAKWNEIPKTVTYDTGDATVITWIDSIGSKYLKVYVPVTNTGTADLYMDDISIDIEDSTGHLLQTIPYVSGFPEYIKPGETGYYYDEVSCDFSETNVRAVPHVSIEKATKDVIRYEITDVSIVEDDLLGGIKVLGRVENKYKDKGSMVLIAARLFDTNGNLLCVFSKYLSSLVPNVKTGFTISDAYCDNITVSDVASYEIYAYPTQYNW